MPSIKTENKPKYSPEFFDRCTSLFLRFESGHMGSDMYHSHRGVYGAQPMSGVLTWEDHAKQGTIPQLARKSFLSKLADVAQTVGEGLPIVEYGPGSMDDAKHLIVATKCNLYVPVDLSEGIIDRVGELAGSLANCRVKPIVKDIFSGCHAPIIKEPAFAVLLGGTIANIPCAVPSGAPRYLLIEALRSMKRPIGYNGGYFLVSTHAEQDGQRNKDLYNEEWHRKFGVNFLYRMQEELPTDEFNPDWFEYLPVWHEHCSLLAHCIKATRDQCFSLGEFGEIKISVSAGEVFHYNNSFKYESTFFEDCANTAGLQAIKKWEDEDHMMLYLFKVPSSYHVSNMAKSLIGSSIYSLAV